MRTTLLTSLALATLSLVSGVHANPEPCSDHPGVVHAPGEYGPVTNNVAKVVKIKVPSSSSKSSAKSSSKKTSAKAVSTKKASSSSSTKSTTKSTKTATFTASNKAVKKKTTPKVKNSNAGTVSSGASKAISGFTNSSLIDPAAGKALESAISSIVDKQLNPAATVTLTATSTLLSTATANVTRTEVVANSTIFVPQPTTLVQTVYQNVTQTSTLITSQEAVAASLDIKQALAEAFAAANLSQNSLDAATTASLEECLEEVMAAGGMPEGYSCVTSSGSDAAGLTATLNTILEQFVGILPNKILQSAFDSISPLLTTLLPSSEAALVAQIQDSVKSVIASLSGSSVTALEQVSQCYAEAIQQQGNASSLACFTQDGGAYSTLQTATNGVLEQFVGVLPASLVTAVQGVLQYNLNNTTTPSEELGASVSAQISNAINSVASSLSGNTVTLAEVLQACAAELVSTGNATAASECVTQTTAPLVSQTTIASIAQQFAGYLPSSFFTDLTTYSSSLLTKTTLNTHNLTQSELNSAFESFFNNATSYGAAYTTCILEVQECVTNAVVKTGTIDAVCAGPVDGCSTAQTSTSRMARHRRSLSKRSESSRFGFAGKIRAVTFWKEAPLERS
ncbi:hypothetical protein JCM8547_005232 [Rhodosporidiobolus lusitaniae]